MVQVSDDDGWTKVEIMVMHRGHPTEKNKYNKNGKSYIKVNTKCSKYIREWGRQMRESKLKEQ